uniref:Ferric chelate reductase 1 n=1 Tax=Sinocyclocheilus grahami TaxID=75366 RepID=A0A672T281_SINGR
MLFFSQDRGSHCLETWNLQTALAILGTLCLTSISGYKNEKVEKSCESMMPEHHSQHNTTASPYTLTVNTSQFSPGDNIGVSIVILSGSEHFEGFLIQARGATNPDGPAIGSFTWVDPDISQRFTCNRIEGSAVSHTSNAKKTEIQPFIVRILLQFTSVGCGKLKSCLIDPVGCNPSVDKNCFFLSYSALGQTVSFELSGPAQGYVSFALSKDEWMGDNDAYLCINDEGRVSVEAAHTTGRTYPEISSEMREHLMSVLTDVGWKVSDGVIQCKLSRSIYTPQDPVRFSLNNSYYLFVAHGSAEYGEHTRQPLISSHHQIITGPPEILTASRSPLLMKCHGMCSAVIKFTYCNDTGSVQRAGAHPYLGCMVMILAFCQQSFLFLRRWIFNSSHWGVGNAAEIIAGEFALCNFQQSLLLPYPWTTGVLSAFVVWTIVLKLVLKLHKNGLAKIDLKPTKKYMMSLFLHLNRFGEV